jgi:hypothetical protein
MFNIRSSCWWEIAEKISRPEIAAQCVCGVHAIVDNKREQTPKLCNSYFERFSDSKVLKS